MIVDLEKAKQEFIKYTENFDLTEKKHIELKQKHSLRVMENSKEIATRMGLDQEKIELAELIGLLHDIARFEQYKQFKTFSDAESFDHGDYGAKLLFTNQKDLDENQRIKGLNPQDKFIRKFIETDKYDNIIEKAIKNHNKFEIENGLNDEELFYAKLIRDADKTDIIYESIIIFWKGNEEQINNSKITDKYMQQLLEHKLFKREKGVKIEGLDSVLAVAVFVFDINYKESFQILKERDYMNQVLDRFEPATKEDKEKWKMVKDIINNYVEEHN